MEQFERAKTVRLRSSHGKYLWADDDMVSVSQQRDSGEMAVWQVEFVAEEESVGVIRLKSAFGGYLTASDEPFLLGMTGKKILQSRRPSKDSSVSWLESWIEWEPVADRSSLVKLRTRHGNYLRGNGGIPPWRNSVTHDVPVRSATQNWVLWGVEIVESIQQQQQRIHEQERRRSPHRDVQQQQSQQILQQQLSFKIPVSNGRLISYTVVSDLKEEIDPSSKDGWASFHFKGHTLGELREALKQELGVSDDGDDDDLLVCTRNAVSGKVYPLQLGLPPNNAPMTLVIVRPNSKQ